MTTLTETISPITRMLDQFAECLTPEVAQRFASLKADPKIQALLEEFSEKLFEGTITPDERHL